MSSLSPLYGPRPPMPFSAALAASPRALWRYMAKTICKKSMTQETRLAAKQSRCAFAKRFAVCHLIAVGHVEVAMPSNIVDESVHCGYGGLTDQSQRCLIQVNTLTEAGIIQSIKRRGSHHPRRT